MKLILIFITVYFLLDRIKQTPRCLNKLSYDKELKRAQTEASNVLSAFPDDMAKQGKIMITVIAYFLALIPFFYYIVIGKMFDGFISWLSILQALTVIYTFWEERKESFLTRTSYSYLMVIVNLVLDYIYYPLVLVALMTK